MSPQFHQRPRLRRERAPGQGSFFAPNTNTEVGVGGAAIDGAVANVVVPVAVFTVSAAIDSDGEFGVVSVVGVPDMPAITFELANLKERACRKLNGDVIDCDLDGDTADLDDDGDGQDDADEPACARLGAGTDLDRDCLCDPVDPFPDCASNDPLDCTVVALPDCGQ